MGAHRYGISLRVFNSIFWSFLKTSVSSHIDRLYRKTKHWKQRTRCHSFIHQLEKVARNKASDVSAGNWWYQTHEQNYRNFRRVVILFFSVVEILINNCSLYKKYIKTEEDYNFSEGIVAKVKRPVSKDKYSGSCNHFGFLLQGVLIEVSFGHLSNCCQAWSPWIFFRILLHVLSDELQPWMLTKAAVPYNWHYLEKEIDQSARQSKICYFDFYVW